MRRQSGLTLLELIVALVVIGVLLSLAAPAWWGMVERNRITTQVNEFITAATLARSEATRRGNDVLLCASRTATQPRECDGEDWTDGWIVKEDGADEPIRVWDAPAGQPDMEVTDGDTTVSFQRNGRADGRLRIIYRGSDAGGQQVDVFCREIVINSSGRARVNAEWTGESPC